MKPNVPKTNFAKKMFATVGNIGIAGDRLINRQANQISTQVATGGGGGVGPVPVFPTQTISVCVNGSPGTMVVYGNAPIPD